MVTMVVSDTLGFLVGTWTVERSIDDHRSGISGHFQGQAVLVACPGGEAACPGEEVARLATGAAAAVARASYQETGELRFGDHAGPARRGLDYVRQGGAVMLYFTNGRPYVDLDLRSGTWRAEHPCVADLYEVTTIVRSPDELQELWRVRGPDKNYDATTTLRRVTVE
jgi:hypothetical protein